MGIIDELDKLVVQEDDGEFEERGSMKRTTPSIDGDEDSELGVARIDDIIEHLDAVKAAARYMDKLIVDQPDTDIAFEAERSLRDAIEKMERLSKEVYKIKAKTQKHGRNEE